MNEQSHPSCQNANIDMCSVNKLLNMCAKSQQHSGNGIGVCTVLC